MPARINKKIRKGATNENPRKSCVDACPCARATTTGSARAFHSAAQPQNLHFPRRETIFFPRALLCGTNKIVRRGGDGRTDNQGKKYIYILGATPPLDVEGYLLRLNDLDKTKQPPVQT